MTAGAPFGLRHAPPSWWGVGFLVWVSSACTAVKGAENPQSEAHVLVGSMAPWFDLADPVHQNRADSRAIAGKVAIVDFWATWCTPCRQSFPVYEALAKKYPGKLRVVGISVDENADGIADFVRETRVHFAIGWDGEQLAAKAYAPPTMPTSYVIDRAGVVRHVHAGFHTGDETAIEAEVKQLLE